MPGADLMVVPAQASRPAAAGVEASGLAARAAAYAEASLASSTRRAYNSSWRTFAAWCGEQQVSALPATPETLAAFLTDIAPGAKVATLSRHIAGIRRAHQAAGFQFPDHPKLDEIWSGIRREHGAPPNRKRALTIVDLRRVIARLPLSPAGLRDKALLLLGFAAALRRSELVALELGETALNRCTFVAGGLEIRLGRSKTDQESHGQVVAVPHGKTKLCPVAALRAWLDVAGIRQGSIFRGITRHGSVAAHTLTDRAIADIIKRAVERAGLDPSVFSGHSLRAGFVTTAALNDVPTELIMRQTRHTKAETLSIYVREANLFKRNAAARVGL